MQKSLEFVISCEFLLLRHNKGIRQYIEKVRNNEKPSKMHCFWPYFHFILTIASKLWAPYRFMPRKVHI